MKTFVKIFVSAAIVASLYSCNFFGSDPKEEPKKDPSEQPVDTLGKKADTLNTVERPAEDSGAVIKQEVKDEVKN